MYRREEELAELLIKSGAEVNKTDDQGEPPIFQAVRGGKKSENVFDLLLKYTNRVELNRITTKVRHLEFQYLTACGTYVCHTYIMISPCNLTVCGLRSYVCGSLFRAREVFCMKQLSIPTSMQSKH